MLSFHTQRQSRNSTKWYQMNQVKCRQVAKTRLLSGCELEVQVHAGVLEAPEVDSRNHHRSPRSLCSPVLASNVLQNLVRTWRNFWSWSPDPTETLWWLRNLTIFWCSLKITNFNWGILRPFFQNYATCGLISVPFAFVHLFDFTIFIHCVCVCIPLHLPPLASFAVSEHRLGRTSVQTSKEQLIPRFSLGHSASWDINSGDS